MELLVIILFACLISGYQVYRCLVYLRKSIRLSHNYNDKIEQGCVKWWEYLFFFIPIRYHDYIDIPGLQGGNFYITPLVGFFALYGNPMGWILILFLILLSTGGLMFRLMIRLMLRLPFYWSYFVALSIIVLAVDGLRKFALNDTQLILINIILGLLLLFNRGWLPVYPYNYWAKRPSVWFDTPLLRYLEENARGYRVNNLPYPVYHGQINHIKSMGYMGGNYIKSEGEFREIGFKDGTKNAEDGAYNWFEIAPDSEKVDMFGVKYHIGDRPSDNPKWVKVFDNLWENREVCDNDLTER